LQEEQWDALRPFLTLASKLGSLCAQLKPKLSRIEHLEFAYEGKIGKRDKETSMLTAVALKSMLSFFTSGVNIVNARVVARKMGIKVSERKTEEAETFPSLLSISMRTEDGNVRTVSGTLFEGEPRVVKIDGYRVDAVPSGFMLVCSFLDKPRVIGPVCTILGDHRINIAGMQVGRKERGGEAVMVLNVDSDVDDAVLEEIKKVPNILDVKSVKL